MSGERATRPRSSLVERWSRAPSEVDPLTWLAGNRLPLAFALLVPLTASVSLAPATGGVVDVLGQLLAVVLMAAACVTVHSFALPLRGRFSRTRTLIPVGIAVAATVLSAANPTGSGTAAALMPLESWWAPLGFAFVIGALVPYTSIRASLAVGAVASVTSGFAAALAYPDTHWPLTTTIAIALAPVVIATSGAIAFQWQVVTRISRWSESDAPAVVSGHLLQERARLAAVRAELAEVSSRVSEFLTNVADRAEVTAGDSARAAALAAEIRTELVERSNETWLQSVARGRPVTVIDPDHLADVMSERQRASVHALILTVLDSPEVEYPHVLVELRREHDEAIAVAITIDAGLAEGRRIMLLAPHYLSLRAAADDLHWKGGETIRMRFRV